MKSAAKILIAFVIVGIASGGWIVHFHPTWVHLHAASADASSADDSSDNTPNEVPVHVMTIQQMTFHRYVDGYGYIAPRPAGKKAGSAAIASPVAGTVAKVLCDVGQRVSKGDALIQIDDRLAAAAESEAQAAVVEANATLANLKATPRPAQLEAAKLAIEKSQEAVDLAQKTYDRQRDLAAQQGTSEKNLEQAAYDLASAKNDLAANQNQLVLLQPTPQDIAAAEAKVAEAQAAYDSAKTQRELLQIDSPISGMVVEINVNPGEAVDTSKVLLQVIDMDHLTVDLDVPAEQLPSLVLGQKALVIPDRAASQCEGTLSFISPEIDSKAGTVQLGIDLPVNASVRPGMTVRVRIVVEEHADRLAVPRQSVVTDDDGSTIISVVSGDTATHKKVTVGLTEGDSVEIAADGVKAGDTVVTAGAYGLPDSTKIKIVDEQKGN